MANDRFPDERFPNDPYMAGMSDVPPRSPQRFDNELQPDPELAEGPSSTGKVAAFAVGIAILLAAVFYGLNNSSTGNNQASNPPPTKSAQTQPASPTDNKAPGVTTGAAPNSPKAPSAQPGSSEMDQSAPPPTGQNNNTH
ncbi:hypothetical protein [Bradyrhizobium sp. STM 3557]|uniref:hypothetical protein n=1 Tax=Bradyrhizobium sp. STM 3557 TaxID=578920 RepID=UPI003890EA9E